VLSKGIIMNNLEPKDPESNASANCLMFCVAIIIIALLPAIARLMENTRVFQPLT
jgi:hypothetical protein